MEDNEIIKALECCEPMSERKCEECHYYEVRFRCITQLIKDTIDLINRQRAEIERLQKYNTEISTELEKLKTSPVIGTLCPMWKNEARIEAVREFAELFKARLLDVSRVGIGGHAYYMIGESFVDKIVKEMVGDTDDRA